MAIFHPVRLFDKIRHSWLLVIRLRVYLLGLAATLLFFVLMDMFLYDLIYAHVVVVVARSSADALVTDIINHFYVFQFLSLVFIAIIAYFALRYVFVPIQKRLWIRKKFTGDIVHDLRAPLSIMKVNLELAARDPALTDETKRFIEESVEQIDRMAAMVSDILMFDRYDNAKNQLARLSLDLAAIAREASASMSLLAKNKKISFEPKISGFVPIKGDAAAIERMIKNILRNAIEYTPEGGTITLTVARETGGASLRVKDTGPGIAPADLGHIFERFYQGSSTKKMGGLGLAIVKEIVDKHNGKITVESELGKGTEISVVFP